MLAFLFIAVPVAITILLTVPAASWSSIETWVSLTASGTAFTLMAINIVLAARLLPLERLFGGLDRVYFVHKWSGIAILLLVLMHYFIEPNFQGLALSSLLNELAAETGEIAFYTLVLLIVISYVKRLPKLPFELPYGIWRLTHYLMGPVFLAVAFHQSFIKRPYSGADLLSDWLNLISIVGFVAYFYGLLAPFLRKKGYEVVEVMREPLATIVRLKPDANGIPSRPGQFAFVSVNRPGLKEPHPFTIAKRDEDGTLTFAIRALGDFTTLLREAITEGDRAKVCPAGMAVSVPPVAASRSGSLAGSASPLSCRWPTPCPQRRLVGRSIWFMWFPVVWRRSNGPFSNVSPRNGVISPTAFILPMRMGASLPTHSRQCWLSTPQRRTCGFAARPNCARPLKKG